MATNSLPYPLNRSHLEKEAIESVDSYIETLRNSIKKDADVSHNDEGQQTPPPPPPSVLSNQHAWTPRSTLTTDSFLSKFRKEEKGAHDAAPHLQGHSTIQQPWSTPSSTRSRYGSLAEERNPLSEGRPWMSSGTPSGMSSGSTVRDILNTPKQEEEENEEPIDIIGSARDAIYKMRTEMNSHHSTPNKRHEQEGSGPSTGPPVGSSAGPSPGSSTGFPVGSSAGPSPGSSPGPPSGPPPGPMMGTPRLNKEPSRLTMDSPRRNHTVNFSHGAPSPTVRAAAPSPRKTLERRNSSEEPSDHRKYYSSSSSVGSRDRDDYRRETDRPPLGLRRASGSNVESSNDHDDTDFGHSAYRRNEYSPKRKEYPTRTIKDKPTTPNTPSTSSRYEIMELREEITVKDSEISRLRNEIDHLKKEHASSKKILKELDRLKEEHVKARKKWTKEMDQVRKDHLSSKQLMETEVKSVIAKKSEMETQLRQQLEDEKRAKETELEQLKESYNDELESVRSSLVDTFKNDLEEMKREWEEAFYRLKEDHEVAKLALEKELSSANTAKAEADNQIAELNADFASRWEAEERQSKDRMEELTRSKEEDLERLRNMYEEHIETIKKRQSDAENDLKEEINCLLEENEKVKRCYDSLEEEMKMVKKDVETLDADHQRTEAEKSRCEKEIDTLREELQCVLEENERAKRRQDSLEDELTTTKEELSRMTSSYERSMNEKSRYEHELDLLSKEKQDAMTNCRELNKQLEEIDNERELEGRYTEALVKQRDNMNAIIENNQREIEELKLVNQETIDTNEALQKQYQELSQELLKANEELSNIQEELRQAHEVEQQHKQQRELEFKEQQSLETKLKETNESLKETNQNLTIRIDSLSRERERYNATVKALKVDLQVLHRGNIGSETSLQEHMRLLNEKWEKHLSAVDEVHKLKTELQESVSLLEDASKERDRLLKDHKNTLENIESDLQEAQTALIKMERLKLEADNKLSDYEITEAKKQRMHEEMKDKISHLEDRLEDMDEERKMNENNRKEFERERRSLQAELDKTRLHKTEVEVNLRNLEDVKKDLMKKLEAAYFDLEECQREASTVRQENDEEIRMLEAELEKASRNAGYENEVKSLRTKNSSLEETIEMQEDELASLKERMSKMRKEHAQALEDQQNETVDSYKSKLKAMEEKHIEEERRLEETIEKQRAEFSVTKERLQNSLHELENTSKKYIDEDEAEKLRTQHRQMEETLKEYKELLDQKQMGDIKRRGEFAKQRQELEILRSKERHLETHVCQLEEHISKVVSDYEAKLQSGESVMSHVETEKALKKQVRELEKKLEVSSVAMKQLGKSSLLLEKENERLKNDKNELKQKLKKLVDCAEKFSNNK